MTTADLLVKLLMIDWKNDHRMRLGNGCDSSDWYDGVQRNDCHRSCQYDCLCGDPSYGRWNHCEGESM